MAWLAFTKKAQTRNIALLELKHLFRTLEVTSGIPKSFWQDPYAVGFVFGYTMGAGLFVAKKRLKPPDVLKASVDVLYQLVPDHALEVAKRFNRWHETNAPHFHEGQTNGTILALFLLGTNAADKESVVIEARQRSHEISAVLDALHTTTDERGKVGIALRRMLFYDRIQKLR
jgi:hypothetical protein